jgi:ribosomal protein S25
MVLVIFPPFNKFIEQKWNFHFSRGVKILLIFVGFFAIGSLIIKQRYAKDVPALHISAQDLYNKYGINEILADELYKNKLLEVSGVIAEVTRNSVLIKGVDALSFVKCDLTGDSEKIRASVLEKNQMVTVRGFNIGKSKNGIILRHCERINILKQVSEEGISQSSLSAIGK